MEVVRFVIAIYCYKRNQWYFASRVGLEKECSIQGANSRARRSHACIQTLRCKKLGQVGSLPRCHDDYDSAFISCQHTLCNIHHHNQILDAGSAKWRTNLRLAPKVGNQHVLQDFSSHLTYAYERLLRLMELSDTRGRKPLYRLAWSKRCARS